MSLSVKSVERLGMLADVLDKVPYYLKHPSESPFIQNIDDFDMNVWGCGTAACAAGIAMVHPWFRDLGLGYTTERVKGGDDIRYPRYQRLGEIAALAKFFDITLEAADFMFIPYQYPKTHKQSSYVAARIRKFIARDGKIVGTLHKKYNAARIR